MKEEEGEQKDPLVERKGKEMEHWKSEGWKRRIKWVKREGKDGEQGKKEREGELKLRTRERTTVDS
jgi:hypothetical protein